MITNVSTTRAVCSHCWNVTYLVDVLALELLDQSIEAVLISLNANRLEDGSDIGSRGRGVATEAEEKVSCEVLHFVGFFCNRGKVACQSGLSSSLAIARARLGVESFVRQKGSEVVFRCTHVENGC